MTPPALSGKKILMKQSEKKKPSKRLTPPPRNLGPKAKKQNDKTKITSTPVPNKQNTLNVSKNLKKRKLRL
jgi:hypothetical protein